MGDFSCRHGNERYGACDDASTGIASIGLCQPQSPSMPLAGMDGLRGRLRSASVGAKQTSSAPVYPDKNEIQDWRIQKNEQRKSKKSKRIFPIDRGRK